MIALPENVSIEKVSTNTHEVIASGEKIGDIIEANGELMAFKKTQHGNGFKSFNNFDSAIHWLTSSYKVLNP